MSVAGFIADQRAKHRLPHTLTCALPRGQRFVVLPMAAPRPDAGAAASGGGRSAGA